MANNLTQLLKSVSRSFYTSLRVVPARLRPVLGLGYLLCRFADTLADTHALPLQRRLPYVREFKGLFHSFPLSLNNSSSFEEKLREDIEDGTPAERALLENGPALLNALKSLPRTEQALIQDVVVGVCQGMEMDLSTFGVDTTSLKALESEQELETYLNFIGGEPGSFWTKVLVVHFPHLNKSNRTDWISRGISFGKGLQMVNILRDVAEDLQRGRCYIPRELLERHRLQPEHLLDEKNSDRFFPLYHELIDHTLERLKSGLMYIFSLPRYSVRLRAAVWWPLSLGLHTLAQLRNNNKILDPKMNIKVARSEVYKMMALSAFTLPSNTLVQWEFEDTASLASSSL